MEQFILSHYMPADVINAAEYGTIGRPGHILYEVRLLILTGHMGGHRSALSASIGDSNSFASIVDGDLDRRLAKVVK
jgi:hypothetical protein